MNTAIQSMDHLALATESQGSVCGCNQDWYPSVWQRRAGCGPTTASNLLIYHLRAGHLCLPQSVKTTAEGLQLMEKVWQHVTPTVLGVRTPSLFEKGLQAFCKSQGVKATIRSLLIHRQRSLRPSFPEVASFIREGLSQDSPVAFLNLANGTVRHLDPWHWVTITAMSEDVSGRVEVEICDNLNRFSIDLHAWYESTSRGGGFVYLIP